LPVGVEREIDLARERLGELAGLTPRILSKPRLQIDNFDFGANLIIRSTGRPAARHRLPGRCFCLGYAIGNRGFPRLRGGQSLIISCKNSKKQRDLAVKDQSCPADQ
jgi:hypothetical protein